MAKKKWHKPKLIVLLRASPEEYSLSACKTDSSSSHLIGPDGADTGCRHTGMICPPECSSLADS